ncbi:hypothetical protein [Plantactinospora sp. DSM 117369]
MLHRNVGQLILLAGTLDDVVGRFLLSMVSAAAVKGVSAGQISLSLLYLVGFVVFAVLLGRPVVRTPGHDDRGPVGRRRPERLRGRRRDPAGRGVHPRPGHGAGLRRVRRRLS